MVTTKTIITNFPKTPKYKGLASIVIGIIALLTSVISLYWTRVEFIKSSRPFVWASNFGTIDNQKNVLIQIPSGALMRVRNSPAKIIRFGIEIRSKEEKLFSDSLFDLIRYPDERSQWDYTIGTNDFLKIVNRLNGNKNELIRIVSINYSSIDGGKMYHYLLKQRFDSLGNQWRSYFEDAD